MPKTHIAALLAVLLAMAIAAAGRAQEPEQLSAPRLTVPAPALLPPHYIPYPPEPPVVRWVPPPMNSREGWIYFAPNYMGQMRPRVIMAPYGSYYLYNGQPFYGVSSGRGYLLPMTSGGN